jgi:hypothetical protein
VIQWAGRVGAGKISTTAHEDLAITAESGLSRRRPHCPRPGTHARLAHSTLPPQLLRRRSTVSAYGNFLLTGIIYQQHTRACFSEITASQTFNHRTRTYVHATVFPPSISLSTHTDSSPKPCLLSFFYE